VVRLSIQGGAGRMGKMLTIAALANNDIEFIGSTEQLGHSEIGLDIGLILGIEKLNKVLLPTYETILDKTDVFISFTSPSATLALIENCVLSQKGLVIGTTGFTPQEEEIIIEAGKKIPIVKSSNFSIGINLLLLLVERIARTLGDKADIEIIETHHRHKKDAPSGTALALAKSIAKGLSIDLEENAVYGRKGISGERPINQIGIHAIRAGEIVGDHRVLFALPEEEIEVRHNTKSRAAFADGAIRAAKWLYYQKPGLYSMLDVIEKEYKE
jgi:4-hydroxy-tetrahydrodipicolinate reductase